MPLSTEAIGFQRVDLQLRLARTVGNRTRLGELCAGMPVISQGRQAMLDRKVFLHIETTGLPNIAGSEAIELYAMGTDCALNPVDYFYTTIRPEARRENPALCLNGWRNDDLAYSPLARGIYRELATYLNGAAILSFNTPFTSHFLAPCFEPGQEVMFVDISRLLRTVLQITGPSLSEAARQFANLEIVHVSSPAEKAEAAFRIYSHIVEEKNSELMQYLAQNTPVVANRRIEEAAEPTHRAVEYMPMVFGMRQAVAVESGPYRRLINAMKDMIINSIDDIFRYVPSEESSDLGHATSLIDGMENYNREEARTVLERYFRADAFRRQKVARIIGEVAEDEQNYKRILKWNIYFPRSHYYCSASFRTRCARTGKSESMKESAKIATFRNLLNELWLGDAEGFRQAFNKIAGSRIKKEYVLELLEIPRIKLIASYLNGSGIIRGLPDRADFNIDKRLDETVRMAVASAGRRENVLVITENRERARKINNSLNENGISSALVLGGTSEKAKQRALDNFTGGSVAALVVTKEMLKNGNLGLDHPLNIDLALLDLIRHPGIDEMTDWESKVHCRNGRYYYFEQDR